MMASYKTVVLLCAPLYEPRVGTFLWLFQYILGSTIPSEEWSVDRVGGSADSRSCGAV